MATYTLTADIHCSFPSWVFDKHNKKFQDTKYRIYINNELMVERSWIWGNNKFIREELIIEVEPGSICNLKLEPVVLNIAQAKFDITNLTKNKLPYNSTRSNLELSFII